MLEMIHRQQPNHHHGGPSSRDLKTSNRLRKEPLLGIVSDTTNELFQRILTGRRTSSRGFVVLHFTLPEHRKSIPACPKPQQRGILPIVSIRQRRSQTQTPLTAGQIPTQEQKTRRFAETPCHPELAKQRSDRALAMDGRQLRTERGPTRRSQTSGSLFS